MLLIAGAAWYTERSGDGEGEGSDSSDSESESLMECISTQGGQAAMTVG